MVLLGFDLSDLGPSVFKCGSFFVSLIVASLVELFEEKLI